MDAYSYEGRKGGMDEKGSERVDERSDEGMVKRMGWRKEAWVK